MAGTKSGGKWPKNRPHRGAGQHSPSRLAAAIDGQAPPVSLGYASATGGSRTKDTNKEDSWQTVHKGQQKENSLEKKLCNGWRFKVLRNSCGKKCWLGIWRQKGIGGWSDAIYLMQNLTVYRRKVAFELELEKCTKNKV